MALWCGMVREDTGHEVLTMHDGPETSLHMALTEIQNDILTVVTKLSILSKQVQQSARRENHNVEREREEIHVLGGLTGKLVPVSLGGNSSQEGRECVAVVSEPVGVKLDGLEHIDLDDLDLDVAVVARPSPIHEIQRTDTPTDTLLHALLHASEESVKKLVKSSNDANKQFGPIEVNGKQFTMCTPLAIAIMRDQVPLVRWLIENSADPESQYGFIAGAAGMQWTGPCAVAAVPSGGLLCLKALMEMRADMHAKSSNNANLLWQAAYFSQLPIVNYLIKRNADIQARAVSQDDEHQSYTPLHVAAKLGHVEVVAKLLDAKADPNVCDRIPTGVSDGPETSDCQDASITEQPPTQREISGITCISLGKSSSDQTSLAALRRPHSALEDAISGGHASVVKLLVAHGATSLLDGCLDLAFESNNSFVVAAIAEGLGSAPALLDRLNTKDLIRFLKGQDQIPCLIMRSIFQPYTVRFWRQAVGKTQLERDNLQFAFYSESGLHVGCGPHPDTLEQLYNCKMPLPESIGAFLRNLAPQERLSWNRMSMGRKMTLGPVRFLVCHVPRIHADLDVLLALANSSCDEVFLESPCEAMIQLAARNVRFGRWIRAVMAALQVLCLVMLNVVVNEEDATIATLNVVCFLGFVVYAADVMLYILEGVGYWCQGLLIRFLDEWFHGVALVVTLGVFVETYRSGANVNSAVVYCTTLGVVAFVHWMELLFELCQFQKIGMRILPIVFTFLDIGPFCCVLLVGLFASANLYYALGLYDSGRSWILMYRLVLLQDFDLLELDGDQTQYFWIVRGLLIFVSFTMSISLMNLFVAVLTVSYSTNSRKAKQSALRFQVGAIVEAQAVFTGWLATKYLFRWNAMYKNYTDSIQHAVSEQSHKTSGTGKHSLVTRALEVSSSALRQVDTVSDVANAMFMWVCAPADV